MNEDLYGSKHCTGSRKTLSVKKVNSVCGFVFVLESWFHKI